MPAEGREKAQAIQITQDCPMNTANVAQQLSTSHCHVPDEKFDYGSRNRLIIVLILCFIFMVIEIIGGILSNSTAVITDATHMGIDVASFVISLSAMYLATKQPTLKLSFGYVRAEVLGALASVLTIWVATGILVYMAIERCINQNFIVRPTEMIIVASFGVLFNIVMFFVLHANVCGSSIPHHGHSHGGNHGHPHGGDYERLDDSKHNHAHDNQQATKNYSSLNGEIASGQKVEKIARQSDLSDNINVRAAIIHVIGDFVQSIGVLVAAILIKINPEYKLADPICTFVFSVLVLITTITIMRDIVIVLMEGVPSNVNYTRVVDDLLHLASVRSIHSLCIWSLSLQKTALYVHIVIDADRDYLTVLNDAQEMLRREHSISRTTIQVEPYDGYKANPSDACRRIGP